MDVRRGAGERSTGLAVAERPAGRVARRASREHQRAGGRSPERRDRQPDVSTRLSRREGNARRAASRNASCIRHPGLSIRARPFSLCAAGILPADANRADSSPRHRRSLNCAVPPFGLRPHSTPTRAPRTAARIAAPSEGARTKPDGGERSASIDRGHCAAAFTTRASPYGVRKGWHGVRFPDAPDHSGFSGVMPPHARQRRLTAGFVLEAGALTKTRSACRNRPACGMSRAASRSR